MGKYSISDTNFNTIIKRKKRNKNSRSYCCTIKICKDKICNFYSIDKKKISVIPYAIDGKNFSAEECWKKNTKIKVLTIVMMSKKRSTLCL